MEDLNKFENSDLTIASKYNTNISSQIKYFTDKKYEHSHQ
jgi:hypothetical protein